MKPNTLYHQFSLADRSVRGLDGGGEISPPGQARQLEALLPANDLSAQGLGHQANLPLAPAQAGRKLPARLPVPDNEPIPQSIHLLVGDDRWGEFELDIHFQNGCSTGTIFPRFAASVRRSAAT